MNSKPANALFVLRLALALAILPALRAEETPPPTPALAGQPAPADKSVNKDKPVADAAVKETTDGKGMAAENADTATPEPPKSEAKEPKSRQRHFVHGGHNSDNERVSFFQDSTLAAGEKADAVVSIFGSSTAAGEVGDAVVSVIGSSTASGEVGDAVVSVIGNTRVTGGTVGDAAVAVLGSNYVNGHVKGEVVAVLGNVELGPEAVVDGDIICIGGEVIRDPKAIVHGNVQNVAIGGHHFNFDGLHAWFARCLLYARPLAFGENLLWAWCVALALLGFYALLALVAPAGVIKCVQTLEERPGKSILAGVMTLLLTPVAYLLLVLTIFIAIGVVLIPLFSLGLFCAALFGKVVLLAWLGRRITKLLGAGPPTPPVLAVFIGGMMVLGLYTVPILGFIVYKLLGVLGLGVVLYTLLLSVKRNKPAPTAPAGVEGMAIPPVVGETPGAATIMPALPAIISAATLPRAGFWIRMAAVLLDGILFGLVFGVLGHMLRVLSGGFPLWFAIYHVAMWATKGTTVGGIICGLKVVRLDDRPVDWGVAIVRGLSAFLSLAAAGLGFIWVAFDEGKQSWHDKIAGTTIVRLPKGTPLL